MAQTAAPRAVKKKKNELTRGGPLLVLPLRNDKLNALDCHTRGHLHSCAWPGGVFHLTP